MTPFGYIGTDFGTSNSHFASCNCEGELIPQTIRLGGRASLTTCVLWQQPAVEDSHILTYGTEALDTWVQMEDGERATHRFAFGFKPDLLGSERARHDAWAFLLRARLELEKSGLTRPLGPTGFRVVIGVPAEVGEDYKRVIQQVAGDAGLGEVECVEEPLGALAFHLNRGDVSPAEARDGIVVVDFGGGTLDIALVTSQAQGVREPWGDPMLGGRLFDDLFYQWLCDQNPNMHIEPSEVMAVWQKECRELKEHFSNRWRTVGDGLSDFSGKVHISDSQVRRLKNASVVEFKRRASQFTPSPLLRRYLGGLDKVPSGLVFSKPVNLFDRISETLTRHGDVKKLKGTFSRVILTGGSSHWPFMRDLTAEAFGIADPERIVLSHEPETTIGSGLALYNVLRLRNDTRRKIILSHKPDSTSKFKNALSARLDRFATDAAKSILAVLLPRVEKVMWDWYNNGGSLKKVEERIDSVCQQFEKTKEADALVAGQWQALDADLIRVLREHLKQFLKDNEIPREETRYISPETKSLSGFGAGIGGLGNDIARELGELAQTITTLVGTIVALVVAAIKIKVILLAAMAHPILAVIVGTAALLTALGIAEAIGEAVTDAVKRFEFGGVSLWTLKNTPFVGLSEDRFKEKLAAGRETAQTELRASIRETLRGKDGKGLEPLVVQTYEKLIDTVVSDLGVLEQINTTR